MQYNYSGRYNLPKFLRLVHAAGMYVNLRIGPYVCAEWNSGYARNLSLESRSVSCEIFWRSSFCTSSREAFVA